MKVLKINRIKDKLSIKTIRDEFQNNNITYNSIKIDFRFITIEYDDSQYTDEQIKTVINAIQS